MKVDNDINRERGVSRSNCQPCLGTRIGVGVIPAAAIIIVGRLGGIDGRAARIKQIRSNTKKCMEL